MQVVEAMIEAFQAEKVVLITAWGPDGCRVSGSGFRLIVQGFGLLFRVSGLLFRVSGLRIRVSGLITVQGFWFIVQALGSLYCLVCRLEGSARVACFGSSV